MTDPSQAIYPGARDQTVREAVQFLAGLSNVELLASGVRTATGGTNGETFIVGAGFGQAEFILALTNAEDDVDDTLDVYIDSQVGDGTWVNIVHFTQILGNGADALKFVAICPRTGTAVEENVTSDVAAGGTPRNFIGDRVRVRYVIVDPSGADATFTFKVVAAFKS